MCRVRGLEACVFVGGTVIAAVIVSALKQSSLGAPEELLQKPSARQADLAQNVSRALGVRASSVQELAIAEPSADALTTAIEVDGRQWTLKLTKHSVRSPDFQLLVQDNLGRLSPTQPPPSITYKGRVEGFPESKVRASYANGKLNALIFAENEVFGVQPVADLSVAHADGDHVVYRASDWVEAGAFRCGTDDVIGHFPSSLDPGIDRSSEPALGTGLKVAELGLDADVEFYNSNGSSVANTLLDMENIINNVQAIFEAETGITYEVTTAIVRSAEPDPYTSSHHGLLLDEFALTWNSLPQFFIPRDLAHLFTGKNLAAVTGAIGVAEPASVCSPARAYGLVQSKYTDNVALRSSLSAHEIGHNWNACHCNSEAEDCRCSPFPSCCHIMCASLNDCGGVGDPPMLGAFSADQIIAFKESLGCLNDLAEPQSLPFFDDFSSPALDTAKWSFNNGVAITDGANGTPSEPYALSLSASGPEVYQDSELRTNFILLAAQSSILMSYYAEHSNVEAGEQLVVEYWRSGGTWVEIDQVTSDGVDQDEFEYRYAMLPADAYHDQFRLRFRVEVDDPDDSWFIDDVLLTNAPPTPRRPDLLAQSDTGRADDDDLTRLDNSALDKTLAFLVGHTVPGATVTLYADGVLIGVGTASGAETTVSTDGIHDLVDGPHEITARQRLGDLRESADSPSLRITVDTVAPVVTVDTLTTVDATPPLRGAVNDPMATVSVTVASRAYLANNDGQGRWLLSDNTINPPLAVGNHDVQVTARDAAGNDGGDATANELVIFRDGDLDGDGDTDLADFAIFQACFSGAGGASGDPVCDGADLDGDGDVDNDDLEQLVPFIAGPSIPPGMVPIPAGTFYMGDHHDSMSEARPVHEVTLSAFSMDEHEVSKGLWDTVRTWAIANGYDLNDAPGKGPIWPVHSVNWYNCVKWANARSQREGRIPCYYTDPGLTSVYKTGEVEPYVKWGTCAYRLPTEAEWEYAARGGLHNPYRRYPWGNDLDPSMANYWESDDSYEWGWPQTNPVDCCYPPNDYGLYGMAGNVWEWVYDWYGPYSGEPQTNPPGPPSGSHRVCRGGAWFYFASELRCADRSDHYPPGYQWDTFGFRLVLDADGQTSCGNGVTEHDEQCDDGNADNTDACLNTCVAGRCGDGFVWAGVEECDDGNTAPGDGCGATCIREIVYDMVRIPGGSFQMGDTFNEGWSDELPVHAVYLDVFYIGRYEVTKGLWDTVRTWATSNGYYLNAGSGKAADHPVNSVKWFDCVKWCNARSQQEGRTPCYYTDPGLTTVYKTGEVAPYVKWNANGYRLPTEAEWEKAARGGVPGHRFPWSDTDTIQHARANYYSLASASYDTSPTRGLHPTFSTGPQPYTSPVGYFAPNGYGLYDMAGNVWEWCNDWKSDTYYSSSPGSNPTGPASGNYRVLRGGSWGDVAVSLRCAGRVNGGRRPDFRYSGGIGFRLALDSE